MSFLCQAYLLFVVDSVSIYYVREEVEVWICMDSADDEDSINRISFTQENVFGKKMNLDNLDKVQGIIIRLRKNEDAETSKNVLIAMLEELIKRDSAEAKKKKLEEKYDIVMDVETESFLYTLNKPRN